MKSGLATLKPSDRWIYIFAHDTKAVGAATLIAKKGKAVKFTALYAADFSQKVLTALQKSERTAAGKIQKL